MSKLDRVVDLYRRCVTTTFLLAAVVYTAQSQAQVILDGTTGQSGELTGPDFEITDDLGTRAGDNLFHSFSDFSIDTGESATFSGPDDIANVISRVTGNNSSDINGTLRSTMPEADFYFINPNGVTFGPDATLDVQGSFHVSTADELRFEGGGVFSATNPDASGFAVAEPRAFGFFDAEPGTIEIVESFFFVNPGEDLSIIGGDINFTGSGRVDVIDSVVGSAGNGSTFLVGLGPNSEFDLVDKIASAESFRSIQISNKATFGTVDGLVVGVIGGEIILDDSDLINVQINNPDNDGAMIRIEGELLALMNDSEIAGDVRCDVGGACNPGAGADIYVDVPKIQISSASSIASATFEAQDAGSINITADDLFILGDNTGRFTGITNSGQTGSSGNSGNIRIQADSLTLANNGVVINSTFGTGDAGVIEVNAREILIDGVGIYAFTGIGSSSSIDSEGGAGEIFINAEILAIHNGGLISSSTFTTEDAGKLDIKSDYILINGGNVPLFTGIETQAGLGSNGNAGEIEVGAKRLEITNGGAVSSSSLGLGNAGTVTVVADNVVIDGAGTPGFTGIASLAGSSFRGDAGDVVVSAKTIDVLDGEIQTEGRSNSGGRISLVGRNYIVIADSLVISDGIEPLEGSSLIELNGKLVALNNSLVTSLTGAGEPISGSGVVDVNGEFTLISTDSVVDASSSVEISGLLTDFSNQLVVLESQFVDASRLLRESCESGGDLGGSTFVTSGQSPATSSGVGLLPGFYSGALVSDQEKTEVGDPVMLVVPCS